MTTRTAPWSLLKLLLLASLLWGAEYVRRDLWEPDEARFALVSQEMRAGSHWLVPHRQGEFYSHKPPLMFWLTNAFGLLTGGDIGRVAPRLPSFLGAVASLWVVGRLATLWFTPAAGRLAPLLLASSFLFWNKGGFGQIDMLLCGLEMLALYHLFTADAATWRRKLPLAYLFMGLGVLAKGPVGLIVPLGAYAAATLAAREPSGLPKSHWLWGPLIALALPGLWLALIWWQGAPPGFFEELLFKQNIGRIAGEFGGHRKPIYYFLQYFPIDFLPWTLLLPLSIASLRRVPSLFAARRRLIAWILFVVVFFSLSASKRNLYILAAYPAAAMLVAGGAEHWALTGLRWVKASMGAVTGSCAILGASMVVGSLLPGLPFASETLLPGGLALLAGGWLSWRRWCLTPHSAAGLHGFALTTLILFACTGGLVFPALNPLKTPQALVPPAQAHLNPQDRMIMYRMNGEIFSLYADRMGFMAHTDEELLRFLRDAPQPRHLVVALERDVPALEQLLGESIEPVPFTMGHKHLVWIAFPPPEQVQTDG